MGLLAQSRTRGFAPCVGVLLALLAASGPAAAAPKPISGKLSSPAYTVIALAADGKATTVLARDGSFRLRPPAKAVTMHLRAPDGTYAGPIVLVERSKVKRARAKVRRAKRELRQAGLKAQRQRKAASQLRRGRKRLKRAKRLLRRTLKQEASRAILGVRAGARLGQVNVRSGYAKLSKPAPKRWVDASATARARGGVPIGAGNFGYVRSKPVPAPGPRDRRRPGGPTAADPDRDGIPDRLDVDDDGDMILDYADRPSTAGAADHQPDHPPPPRFYVSSNLQPEPGGVMNVNARDPADPSRRAFSDADIDWALRTYGALTFGLEGGGHQGSLGSLDRPELDCGGDLSAGKPALKYCSNPDSTGRGLTSVDVAPGDLGIPFPGELGGPFDLDRDGFGTFPASRGAGSQLYHGATSTEVKTGDLLFQRNNDANGVETGERFPATVQYAFATVPALASYRDTTMAAPATVAYPFPRFMANPPLPVSAEPGQDIVVTLTFWRPQRRPIPPGPGQGGDPCLSDDPPCEWVDIGRLNYGAGFCPQAAFLPEEDPSLTDAPIPPGSQGPVAGNGGYADTALDGPANQDNELTFTVNITECLRRRGQESAFDEPGEILGFGISAIGRGGQVSSLFSFIQAGLTVKKRTDPAESPTEGPEFEFAPEPAIGGSNFKLRHDGTRSYVLKPGTYTVDELAAPGHDLTSVECEDPSSDSTGSETARRATFRIASGEHVKCTFINRKK